MGILDEWCNFAEEKVECSTTEVYRREQGGKSAGLTEEKGNEKKK